MQKRKIIKIFYIILIFIVLFKAFACQPTNPIALYPSARTEMHISSAIILGIDDPVIISQYKMAPFDTLILGNISNLFNICIIEISMLILLFRRYRLRIDIRQQIHQQICHYFNGSKYKVNPSFSF